MRLSTPSPIGSPRHSDACLTLPCCIALRLSTARPLSLHASHSSMRSMRWHWRADGDGARPTAALPTSPQHSHSIRVALPGSQWRLDRDCAAHDATSSSSSLKSCQSPEVMAAHSSEKKRVVADGFFLVCVLLGRRRFVVAGAPAISGRGQGWRSHHAVTRVPERSEERSALDAGAAGARRKSQPSTGTLWKIGYVAVPERTVKSSVTRSAPQTMARGSSDEGQLLN